MASGRRGFLGMVVAAVAALAARRLGLDAATRAAAGARPGPAPAPRGWREARHWRKV